MHCITGHNFETRHPSDDSDSLIPIGLVVSEEKIFEKVYDVPCEAKKNICVFTVTQPTLIFASDPMNFYTEFG